MIPRYTLETMARLWSPEERLRRWIEIEVLAVEGWAQIGRIPARDARAVRARAAANLARIEALERVSRHDVAAFVSELGRRVGPPGRWIHFGLTSSDVLDTALATQLRDAIDRILEETDLLLKALARRVRAAARTPAVARTHGVHAEPTTFGLKLAGFRAEVVRARGRLVRARREISVGKIAGAVGLYGNLDPRVERYVLGKLGLEPETVPTQVVARDRHAAYLAALALAAAALERLALEVRHLQRTEVREVEEPFAEGQKGSSAMPHKRNPVGAENLCGLARLLRGYALAGMEDVALWHERDISHSSVERVALPDATTLLHYMTRRAAEIVEGMRIDPVRMRENLERTRGLVFSERVLLALIEKGLSREEAYRVVQANAMEAWERSEDFRRLVASDPEVRRRLSADEVAACFDLEVHLRHVEGILRRSFQKSAEGKEEA